jgi:hypothetical protein
MPKRFSESGIDALRMCKQKMSQMPSAAPDTDSLVYECWLDRKSASAMLFKARNLRLQNVLDSLIPYLMQPPSPSPMILEYFKETMITLWLQDPKHVNTIIKMLCTAFAPSNTSQFRVAAEICSVYLLNLWAEQHPEEWSDVIGLDPNPPSDAVVPCLRFLLSGIMDSLARKRKVGANASGAKAVTDVAYDVLGAERNVEYCVSTLRSVFSSEGFMDQLSVFAAADESGWTALRVLASPHRSQRPFLIG